MLSSVVDPVNKTVSAQVTHFSLYQVLAPAPTVDAAFQFVDIYSFPNPAVGANPTIHFECGQLDSVEVRIYDIAGSLVHSREVGSGQMQIANQRYSYDYTWDSSGAAGGIYVYVLVGKRAGEKDIRVTNKLAIVK